MTRVYEMDFATGEQVKETYYFFSARESLIAYLQQRKGNYNSWNYPEDMEGIRKSVRPNTLFYDLGDTVVYAEGK